MNKNSKEKSFGLSKSEISAFEREKHDIKIDRKNRKRKFSNKFLTFFRFIFILTFIISAAYMAKWFWDNKRNSQMRNELLQYISVSPDENFTEEEVVPEFSVDFENLISRNSSCFAWLIVNDTGVSYPVVQYKNNDYYLTHSFDGSYNPAGWIFADCSNKCDGTDKNLVIYGHNRRDGSMFSSLRNNILNYDWYSNSDNLTIKLYTPNGLEEYQVFSIYEIKSEAYYITTKFESNSSFLTFANNLKRRSISNFNVELTSEDRILTLSTCSNNSAYRTVLHAKKIQATN